MKNSLSKKGLSMSEAQSVSNICYQKALDIANQLSVINNFSRAITIGTKDYLETPGNKIPDNIVELILSKGKYHAVQAFLMENIKAKEALIKSLQNEVLDFKTEAPVMGKLVELNLLPEVNEAWGKAQLTLDEVNTYLLAEATAAHVGQFIHKNSKLDNLRNELPNISTLEWIEVEAGKKTPVDIKVHHSQADLSELYEKFSKIHREEEQKVNFLKAKVKNLVTSENARIAEVNALEISRVNKLNADIREVFTTANTNWRADKAVAEKQFEEARNKKIQEAASLKIKTAPQFQETVDEILQTLKGDK